MSATDQPRRRGRPPSDSRQAILDAALALVHEAGIAKLTSREIAARAGVSDASIYYHFGDRDGLLKAVYAHGLKPLEFLDTPDREMDLSTLLRAALDSLEAFYDEALPVLHAAESDAAVSRTLAAYRSEHDLGPHRGVARLAISLRAQQAAGRVDPAADPEAAALVILDVAYARASRRKMHLPDEADARMPSAGRVLAEISRSLTPRSPRSP
jgi:AcrR family transcriptional regulator